MEEDGPNASIIFIVLVLIDVFYYGFSTAMEHLNEKEIERKAEEDKDKKSIQLLKIIGKRAEYINVGYLIILMTHVLMGYLCIDRWILDANTMINRWIQRFAWNVSQEMVSILSVVFVFIVFIYVSLMFGILIPQKLAKVSPENWAYAGRPVMNFLNRLLKPFSWLITLSSHLILRLFGIHPGTAEAVTEEEIIDMVNEGQEQGLLEAAEAEMISNIFEYRDKEAQNIMTHRNNIIALDGSMLLKDAIDEVISGKQSRYPVYEENIDHIIGILHLKDAMRYHADHEKLHSPLSGLTDLLREPVFIPQTRNIDELFKQMQSNKLQMVIIIDEYGQTAGLVAMEDILEEIVGNIMDEYDDETEYIEDKGNDEYVIEGKTPLEELEERFHISFGEVEFETLNGFLISKMDKIPEENEQFEIELEGYHFKILSVENKMVHSVLVTKNILETKVEEK